MAHPVVLISGGDEFLVERELTRIWRAVSAANPELIRADVVGGSESAAGDFVEACSPSLFGDLPLVVVDGVEQADESLQKAVFEVIEAANPELLVLLLVRGGVKGRGFVDKLRKTAVEQIVLEMPKGRGFDDFISAEFKRNKRKAPTADAVKALREAVGDDLRALAAAVSQLSSDLAEDPITAEGVSRYYEGMAGVAPYEVSDAVFNGQVTEALTHLRWALERDPGIGPAIVASCISTLRALVHVVSAPTGVGDSELAASAGVPPWKLRTLRTQARAWPPRRLADASLLLTQVDAALKGGQIDALGQVEVLDPTQRQALLERAVVTLASGRRAS